MTCETRHRLSTIALVLLLACALGRPSHESEVDRTVRYQGNDIVFWREYIHRDSNSTYWPSASSPFRTSPDTGAIPLFRKLLEDNDETVRIYILCCVSLLGEAGIPILDHVEACLVDPRDDVVYHAIAAMIAIRPTRDASLDRIFAICESKPDLRIISLRYIVQQAPSSPRAFEMIVAIACDNSED